METNTTNQPQPTQAVTTNPSSAGGSGLFGSLLSGVMSLFGTSLAGQLNERAQKDAQEYNEKQNELARKYDAPAAQAARLRAAGLNPSLYDQMSTGQPFPSQTEALSPGDNIMRGVEGIADSLRGYSAHRLDVDRFEEQKRQNAFDRELKESYKQLDFYKFDDDHALTLSRLKGMDEDTFGKHVSNVKDMNQLAFDCAVSGRTPVGLSDDQQRLFDTAFKSIDRNTTEFRLASAMVNAGLSEAEIKHYEAEAKRRFYDANPLEMQLSANLAFDKAERALSLEGIRITNSGRVIANDRASIARDGEQRSYDATEKAIASLIEQRDNLTFALNSPTFLQRLDPTRKDRLSRQLNEVNNYLDRIYQLPVTDKARSNYWDGLLGRVAVAAAGAASVVKFLK